MKAFFSSAIFSTILIMASCGQPKQADETASDTASILDTTRLNTSADTSAVLDVKGKDSTHSSNPAQYEESNGKQVPRTNIGKDTTGKQEHDNVQKPAAQKKN